MICSDPECFLGAVIKRQIPDRRIAMPDRAGHDDANAFRLLVQNTIRIQTRAMASYARSNNMISES
jgi:hypothetical protein